MSIALPYLCCAIKLLVSDTGRMKTWIKLWLFALALLTVCASAQETLKVSVANNVALVPVRVNGRSLLFVLDTGSELSAIDAALVTPLGLKSVGDVQILRNYRTRETSAAEAGSLGIGKHIFEHTLLTVVDTKAASLALGTRVDGILGNDILGELSFKLNYSGQELVLAPLPQLGSLATPVQLRRSGNKLFVPVQACLYSLTCCWILAQIRQISLGELGNSCLNDGHPRRSSTVSFSQVFLLRRRF
jgi:Aspartyl protease